MQANRGDPAGRQLASLPPAEASKARVLDSGDVYRIPFAGGASELSGKNSELLDKLADRMNRDPSLRLQLLGYSDDQESASQTRRVSLFRVLAVRTYLMKKGIASTRMDVRALGNKNDGAAPDRVDIQVKK